MMSTRHQTSALQPPFQQLGDVYTSRPGNAFVHVPVSIISLRWQILTGAFQLLFLQQWRLRF